jgi:hypothetical protein
VVLPVSVGGGQDPDPALMTALANGLTQNPQWAVEQGESIPSLAKYQPTAMTEADVARLAAEVEGVARKAAAGSADAVETLTRVRGELRVAGKKGPRSVEADGLLWRTSLLLVTAVQGKDVDQAKKVAQETMLLFPGRRPVEADKLGPAATKLFEAPPELGVKLKLVSRPEGCEVFVGPTSVGKAPLELQVLQEEPYWAHVRCTGAPATAAGAAAGQDMASLPKRIVVPPNETTRQEILDAEFERSFVAEGLRRLRFSTSNERRQLEESYARRLAERFDADAVVLASVGELSGADWLNARLYLRSGYLNRQGLVRLEPQRANALGRFLATGKEVPGVLRPEEAGALVAASRPVDSGEPPVDPWYTDIAGWSFLGSGLVTLGFGRWINSSAEDKQNQADALRGDTERQNALYREAQSEKFWGGVLTVGGLRATAPGVVLLRVPEYTPSDEMFSYSPSIVPGGGGLVVGGRFGAGKGLRPFPEPHPSRGHHQSGLGEA